jgi:hypothetical protein
VADYPSIFGPYFVLHEGGTADFVDWEQILMNGITLRMSHAFRLFAMNFHDFLHLPVLILKDGKDKKQQCLQPLWETNAARIASGNISAMRRPRAQIRCPPSEDTGIQLRAQQLTLIACLALHTKIIDNKHHRQADHHAELCSALLGVFSALLQIIRNFCPIGGTPPRQLNNMMDTVAREGLRDL